MSEGDAFLIGAGFSRAVSAHMPLMEDLSEVITQIKDWPSRLKVTDERFDNFELLLSYLQSDQAFLEEEENLENRRFFRSLTVGLAKFLWSSQYLTMSDKKPWLMPLIEKWASQLSPVVTLNYDTILEALMPGHQTNYVKAYPFSMDHISGSYSPNFHVRIKQDTLLLLKLHGSLNWFYSGEYAPQTEWPIDTGNLGRWHSGEGSGEKHFETILNKFPGMTPLIVPPSFGKSPYLSNIMIRETWREARRVLRDPKIERLFLLGYSMPKADLQIRTLIAETMAGKILIPVNTAKKQEGSDASEF